MNQRMSSMKVKRFEGLTDGSTLVESRNFCILAIQKTRLGLIKLGLIAGLFLLQFYRLNYEFVALCVFV